MILKIHVFFSSRGSNMVEGDFSFEEDMKGIEILSILIHLWFVESEYHHPFKQQAKKHLQIHSGLLSDCTDQMIRFTTPGLFMRGKLKCL